MSLRSEASIEFELEELETFDAEFKIFESSFELLLAVELVEAEVLDVESLFSESIA